MAKIDLDEFLRSVEGMSGDQLEAEKKRIEADLEDLEIERRLVIGQTGVHVNAVQIQVYRETFDKDEADLREQLVIVTSMLDERG